MADVGVIGTERSAPVSRKSDRTWTEATMGFRVFGCEAAILDYRYATPRAYVSGVVRSNGVAVSRTVRAYRRDTGELLGSTVSSVAGDYTLIVGYRGPVFVVAFDNDAAPDLNAAIVDKVTPV